MAESKQRALVTGASSGFGVEIARVLAERGIDLVITARRTERLETLAGELRCAHGVDVKVLSKDLAQAGAPHRLFDEVQSLGRRIDILVNNAGFGLFGPFLEQTLAQIEQMIALDISAVTVLTRLFAEAMKKQGGGYILQVASYAALAPIPRYAVYSGAKAHVIAFTQALGGELKKSNVRLSVVAPGFMQTEFHDVSNHKRTLLMKLTTVPVRWTARRAVDGMFKGKLLITPGAVYRVNNWLRPFTPRRMQTAMAGAIAGKEKEVKK